MTEAQAAQVGKLTITVTRTADGSAQYVQIASPAAMPVNIVLIADEIEIKDRRGHQLAPGFSPVRKRKGK